jgi:outer membrane immunogenic protein
MQKVLLGSAAFAVAMVAGVAMVTGPAIAADMPVRMPVKAAPAPVIVQYWSGLYIGGHCGAAWGRTTAHTVDDEDIFDNRLKPTGWLCGGQVGHNWLSGNVLFGLEGDLGYLSLKKSEIQPSDDDNTALRSVKYSWYATLTGRLGYTSGQWLLFVKGGAAFARIKHTGFEVTGDPGDNAYSLSKTRVGAAVGGGVEYAVSPNWSWKLEYLYMDFGRKTAVTSDPDVTVQNRDQVHTVKIGVNYRFGNTPVIARY